MNKPIIFISYSHKDETWKNQVVTQLRVLSLEGEFDLWDDRRIKAGEDWYPAIEKALNEADAAILLVSADFLTSQFIVNEEIPKLLERREKEGVHVFPLIVRPCQWTRVERIGSIQARPKDGKPLSKMTKADREEALSTFVGEIDDILKRAESIKKSPTITKLRALKSLTTCHLFATGLDVLTSFRI